MLVRNLKWHKKHTKHTEAKEDEEENEKKIKTEEKQDIKQNLYNYSMCFNYADKSVHAEIYEILTKVDFA